MSIKEDDAVPMPTIIQFLRDHKGNTLQVGKDISHEQAMEKLGEHYAVELFTYVLQPVKRVTMDSPLPAADRLGRWISADPAYNGI